MNKIITLSREYGAGGHSIGMKVAEKLGIECYDKDIIRQMVKATGYDKELIEEEGEETTRLESFLESLGNISSGYYHDKRNEIRDIQTAIVMNIAKKGPCVIIGRCADEILTKAGVDCFNVFIHADVFSRAKRVGELIGTSDINEIKRVIAKKDTARHYYYEHYTSRRWGDATNYNLCLDSGLLGYDKCAEIITDIVTSC